LREIESLLEPVDRHPLVARHLRGNKLKGGAPRKCAAVVREVVEHERNECRGLEHVRPRRCSGCRRGRIKGSAGRPDQPERFDGPQHTVFLDRQLAWTKIDDRPSAAVSNHDIQDDGARSAFERGALARDDGRRRGE
jgi:hypothetical protein